MHRIPLVSIEHAAKSRPEGYLEDVLAAGELDGDYVVITNDAYESLRAKYTPAGGGGGGPGTELTKILRGWGIVYTPDCPCADRAAEMDAWGPDICARKLPTIVGWMEAEARRRGLWGFSRALAGMLARRAISRARRPGPPVGPARASDLAGGGPGLGRRVT